MTDTPRHIKNLQLKIWLSKPPMERLKQFMIDNEALYMFWKNTNKTTQNTLEQSAEKTSITPL